MPKMSPQKEKLRNYLVEEPERPLRGFKKTYWPVFEQNFFPIVNVLQIFFIKFFRLELDPSESGSKTMKYLPY
jgi:hypothetical protein